MFCFFAPRRGPGAARHTVFVLAARFIRQREQITSNETPGRRLLARMYDETFAMVRALPPDGLR
jgi:hypothetical protein